MRGLYIHVPFCVSKCRYCDFYSLPSMLDLIEPYIQAVAREAQAYKGLSFQTMYLGGGTPSLLGAAHLHNLLNSIRTSLDLSAVEEATTEANPESITAELLKASLKEGINRISIGVQSLSDSELKSVGRIHDAAQAIHALKLVKKYNFKSISADLIIGLPGQTWQSLRHSLETLTDMGISHLSVYCLSLEAGTPLAEAPPHNLPSDDMQAELYEHTCSFLTNKGFIHYEISNFALPGHECQHNLNYWRDGDYLGLGPSAASHLNGRRFKNCADLKVYIQNPTDSIVECEELDKPAKAAEEAMLRLRLLTEGVDIDQLAAKYGKDAIKELHSRLGNMAREGLLVADGSRYRLAPARVLTSNAIFADVVNP